MNAPPSAPLHVCVDVRLTPGGWGGVEQLAAGVIRGLLALEDSRERYSLLVNAKSEPWARSHFGDSVALLMSTESRKLRPHEKALREARRVTGQLSRAISRIPGLQSVGRPPIPRSDGVIEAAHVDVIHFPIQWAFLTKVPSIYQPHDLQHRHFPQFFDRLSLLQRDTLWLAYARQATFIAASATWTARDIQRQWHLAPEKVKVVPTAPPVSEYPIPTPADLAATRAKFNLPERFAFYPAQTFAHKNHLRLIEALAILRDHGTPVPLVCSGKKNDHYTVIEARLEDLNMTPLASFLGFVSPMELQCLYRLATLAVIPSLFEAASFPIWEANHAGTPVAVANVTSLPAQVGDAGLLFDPLSPQDIARAVRDLWTNAELRAACVEKGRANVARFTWERCARRFRALYRLAGNRPLTEADHAALDADPMI